MVERNDILCDSGKRGGEQKQCSLNEQCAVIMHVLLTHKE
jgi:hypothetical protein